MKKSEVLKEGYYAGLKAALNIIKGKLNEMSDLDDYYEIHDDYPRDYNHASIKIEGDLMDYLGDDKTLGQWIVELLDNYGTTMESIELEINNRIVTDYESGNLETKGEVDKWDEEPSFNISFTLPIPSHGKNWIEISSLQNFDWETVMMESDGQYTKDEIRSMILNGDPYDNLLAYVDGSFGYDFLPF